MSPAPDVLLDVNKNDLIEFNYVNHRGLTQTRTCYVVRIGYGTTPYHLEPQWFLTGEDPEKGWRSFALKDMKAVRTIRKATR